MGGLDSRKEIVDLAPVFLAGGFDVINLGRNVRFARNANQLVERFEQLVSFASHVRDVFPFIFRGDLAELDQFIRLGVKRGRINQRRSDAEGARFHFFAHELAHLVELLLRRRAIVKTDDVLADCSGADERGDVAGNAALLQKLQILRQHVPFDVVFNVGLLAQHVFAHAIVHRPH